jgi:hypothetical protein
VAVEAAVICLMDMTIFPSKSVVGAIESVPVDVALGPQALVAKYAPEVCPPNVIVKVPAVLLVTVNAIW